MSIRSLFVCGIIQFYLCSVGFSQSGQLVLLPIINLNKQIKNDWRANIKLESRQLLNQEVFGEDNDWMFDYLLTDIAFLVSNKVGLNNKLAGGYLLRIRNGELVHRSIQQFTIVQNKEGVRLAHRLSMDQTKANEEPIEYRFRYRITTEIPLNGNSVDPNEWYVKFNNEYLNSFEGSEYDLEIRFIPYLGLKLDNTSKLEFGIDYRIDSFLSNETRNRFFVSLNWFKII